MIAQQLQLLLLQQDVPGFVILRALPANTGKLTY